MKSKQLVQYNLKHETPAIRQLYNITTDEYVAYTFIS